MNPILFSFFLSSPIIGHIFKRIFSLFYDDTIVCNQAKFLIVKNDFFNVIYDVTLMRVKVDSLRLVKDSIKSSIKILLLVFSKNRAFNDKLIRQTVLQSIDNSLTSFSKLSDLDYILEISTVFS